MLNFHKHVNADGEVLILKRIPQDRKTYGGFVWPSGVGTVIEAPDWNDRPECGGGLHGWPWGWGLGDGMDYDIIGDVWLVLGAKPEDVIGELSGGAKCKARRVAIRLEGSFGDAMKKVAGGFAATLEHAAEEGSVDNYSTSAANGYNSTSAANGDNSKSAANGDNSKSAANGNYSTSAANGYNSTSAANGNYSKSAANGDNSKSAANGDNSKSAANGNYSKSAANGKNTLSAVLGNNGQVMVGERGAFALAYWSDVDGWRFLTGKAGENGIEANRWYEVKDGQIVEV